MELRSNYLLISNKTKVKEILSKSEKTDIDRNEIIDVYVGLHLIFEIGINNFFREIIIPTFKKKVNNYKMIKDIDNISFSDKITMFVYYSKFNFSDIEKATQYQQIVGKTKHFGTVRNWLLHGHIISSTSTDGKTDDSDLFKRLTVDKLQKHLTLTVLITVALLSAGLYFIDKEKTESTDASANYSANYSASSTAITTTSTEEYTPSKEFMENAREMILKLNPAYDLPSSIALRKIFDNYVKGDIKEIPEMVLEKSIVSEQTCGLDSFDKKYYKSKFIIWDIEEAVYGGNIANIVFVDYPDTLFWTWVYNIGDDDNPKYEMRGFCESDAFKDSQKEFKGMMKALLDGGAFTRGL